MKDFFKKTSSLSLILVCLLAITTYFSIQTIITYRDNMSIKEEITTLKNEQQADITKTKDVDEDSKTISSLKEEIDLKQKESEEYRNSREEIQYFLDKYDKAMTVNLADYSKFTEKQNHIKSTLSPLFTDDAWEDTPYYDMCIKEEFMTSSDGIKRIVNLTGERKDITRAYYKNIKKDSADIVLKINNVSDKCTEYQIIKVTKDDNNWVISNYRELK